MEQEYDSSSSDDSVQFGPYTIEDAKRDARKCKPRDIDRRHSDIWKYRHFDIPHEADGLAANLKESCDISSNPSEYFTSNETLQTEGENKSSSDFLEKLSKVINEPVSPSSYNTACDRTNDKEHETEQQGVLEDTIITISDDSSLVYQFISDEDLDMSRSPVVTHTEKGCQDPITEAVNDESREEILEFKSEKVDISSDSTDVQNSSDKVNDKVSACVHLPENAVGAKNQELCLDYNRLSKISEKTEYTTYCNTQEATNRETSNQIPDIEVSYHPTSPVQIPEINLDQFDDSSDFNDTLDEINRFLEQGGASPPQNRSNNADMSDNDIEPNNIHKCLFSPVSEIFVNAGSQEGSALKTKSPNLKVLSQNVKKASSAGTTKSAVELHGPSKIKPPSTSTAQLFKLPSKPVKKLATPSKIPSLNNIVSPVGIYIKHSPKFSPLRKVTPNKSQLKNESKLFRARTPDKQKENIPVGMDIPPVIYKSAKTKLASEVRDVNLPPGIQRLIKEQVVTRHERRIDSRIRNQSVERRLLESDLSIDVSQDNLDVSIRTHKQPFNIKK